MINQRDAILSREGLAAYEGKFSYWKAGILAILTLISALLSGYFMEGVTYRPLEMGSGSSWYLGIFVFSFLSLFLLSTLFIEKKLFLFFISLGSAIFLVLPTIMHFNYAIFTGLKFLSLLIVASYVAGRNQIDEVIKFRFFRVSGVILSRLILGLALISAIFVYDVFSTKPLDENNPVLPQSVFEKGTQIMSNGVSSLLGGVDFSMSLRSLSEKVVNESIIQSGTDTSLIPQSIRDELIQTAMKEYQSKLKSVFGSEVNPDQKISVAIYTALLEKFNRLGQTTKSIVLVGLAFLFFLTVQALSPIIRLIVSLVSFVIFELLMALNFGAIVYEKKSKETIILP